MAAWIKLNEKVRAKRTKKDPPKDHRRRPKGEELTVQRLSAEVAGKAQKYTRVGPREFVPFDEDEEMTIGNIKSACERYFLTKIGKNLVCDVLAGEQGPSCNTVSQIPDLKVVYVRFIPTDSDGGDGDTTSMIRKRKINVDTQSSMSTDFLPPQPKTRSSPSKLMQPKQQLPACTSTYFPRSLSISDMLKLGKINNETATKIVKIFKFDMERLSWSKVATTVEFYEERGPIGTGGFRKAFKATSKHAEFIATTWVIKCYLPDALKCIAETGQTVEQHNRKVVQMHLLSRNFASQLEAEVKTNGANDLFGTAFRYRKIFHGETEDKEYVTVEEFIPGVFTKYINNNGSTCVDRTNVMARRRSV
ncbi:hypothetical protein OS493_007106 [Desmophyllum pertusum]|uniref:Alpha-type protein kinase domain-containing protein n=1 Tax=Desmophyllum pertusum TaxID=174260 RepID=A0A9W9ZFE3_9CNID|nr:hypothetical protein OS493_007106 [Desmophyllum pertusum]